MVLAGSNPSVSNADWCSPMSASSDAIQSASTTTAKTRRRQASAWRLLGASRWCRRGCPTASRGPLRVHREGSRRPAPRTPRLKMVHVKPAEHGRGDHRLSEQSSSACVSGNARAIPRQPRTRQRMPAGTNRITMSTCPHGASTAVQVLKATRGLPDVMPPSEHPNRVNPVLGTKPCMASERCRQAARQHSFHEHLSRSCCVQQVAHHGIRIDRAKRLSPQPESDRHSSERSLEARSLRRRPSHASLGSYLGLTHL